MDWAAIFENTVKAFIGINAVYFAIAAIGLNVQFGFTGLLNFGQAAFMAAGAYGLGMTAKYYEISFWWGIAHRDRVLDRARPADGRPDAAPAGRLPGDRHDRHRRDHPPHRPVGEVQGSLRWQRRDQRLLRRVPKARHRHRLRAGRPVRVLVVHVHRTRDVDADRRLGSRRHLRDARLRLDEEPVGAGAEGDPGGRDRGAQPRQERLQLQDAVADPRRRDRHLLGDDLRPRPRFRAARQLQPRRDVLRADGAGARRRGEGLGLDRRADVVLGGLRVHRQHAARVHQGRSGAHRRLHADRVDPGRAGHVRPGQV